MIDMRDLPDGLRGEIFGAPLRRCMTFTMLAKVVFELKSEIGEPMTLEAVVGGAVASMVELIALHHSRANYLVETPANIATRSLMETKLHDAENVYGTMVERVRGFMG